MKDNIDLLPIINDQLWPAFYRNCSYKTKYPASNRYLPTCNFQEGKHFPQTKSTSNLYPSKIPAATTFLNNFLLPVHSYHFIPFIHYIYSYRYTPTYHSRPGLNFYINSHIPFETLLICLDHQEMEARNVVVFEDFFPAMVDKLGAEGFMKELSNGFRLLMDGERGMITFESLKRSLGLLGLQGMSDEEVVCMLREGDLDGDGALDEMEFCTLMFRLSPALMKSSRSLLVEALVNEM